MSMTNNFLRGCKSIRLPLVESNYNKFENDVIYARKEVDRIYQEHPELFPTTFTKSYIFNGRTPPSVKQGRIPIEKNTTARWNDIYIGSSIYYALYDSFNKRC